MSIEKNVLLGKFELFCRSCVASFIDVFVSQFFSSECVATTIANEFCILLLLQSSHKRIDITNSDEMTNVIVVVFQSRIDNFLWWK